MRISPSKLSFLHFATYQDEEVGVPVPMLLFSGNKLLIIGKKTMSNQPSMNNSWRILES